MKRIGATDAAFLDLERPNTPPLIGVVIVLDPATAPGGFVRHRDILAYVERRLHLAPNLRRRLVANPLRLDEPRLVDDPDFDLEFHVRHLGLPKPRDRRQLNILVARLMSRPMDLQRPLWELYVIEGLEEIAEYPSDAFAILLKLHHAAFDGAAGLAAIWALMQDAPSAEPPPPEGEWQPAPRPGAIDWAVSSLAEGAAQWLDNIAALPGLGARAAKGLRATAGEAPPPATRFQGRISSHRTFDWLDIPQASLKAARVALGKPKMNDLVLAIIGGGLRRYLADRGELPGKALLALCPINVRGAGDPREGGNQVAAMRVTLGTNIADPRERLAAIADSSAQGKAQAEQLGGTFFAELMALAPYVVRSPATRSIASLAERVTTPVAIANTVVTNVPPPVGDWYFAGSRFLAYAGTGMVSPGYGLFHVVAGIASDLSISVTSTREIMPDVADYVACLRASWEEMRDVALEERR